MSAVTDELRAVAARIEVGTFDAAAVDDAVAAARDAARGATGDERAQIALALAELEKAVSRSLGAVGQELRRLGSTRAALAGFRSVRGWTSGGHLRTKV